MTFDIGQDGRGRSFALTTLTLSLAAAITLASAPAHAHDEAPAAETALADQALVGASNQVLAALAQWERAAAAGRAAPEAALARAAQRRQEQLLLLLQKNPRVALARALPRGLRERLPASAAAFVEQDVSLQGTLRAQVADDFARGASRTVYRLATGGSATAPGLELHVADAPGMRRALEKALNRRVSIAALRIGDHLALGDKGQLQLMASGGTTTGGVDATATTTAANPVVQGDQSTLVILANFTDAAVPCTAADLQARLFGSGGSTLNQGYLESSGGLVSFSGKVIGPFPLNTASNASCDTTGWATTLDAAARAAGFEPSAYKRVSYTMPKNPSCGWNGLASVGGPSPTPSWIQSCTSTGVFTHELGHNLNFSHASTPTSEYGDYTDPMGAAMQVQFSAPNRVMAGWLPTGQVLDVTAGGSYALSALEIATPSSPRVLRLPKPDTAETYYVGMRQLIGVDANLIAGYQNMVTIHRSSGVMPTHTYLVAAISPGQSWSDSVNGIQIVHQGVSGSVATVAVGLGAATCSRAAPAISLTPATQTAGAGATLSYAVTVTNRNTTACPSSTFNLTQALPAGFSGSFSAPTVALASGASATSTWLVTSVASVLDGTYALSASVADAGSGMTASAPASDVVYTAPVCTRGAPLVSVSPSSQTGTAGAVLPYTVTITNRDSAACSSASFSLGQALPAGFSGAFSAGSLTLAPGASSSSGWNVTAASATAGSFTLTATTLDAQTGAAAQAQAVGTIVATVATDTTPPTLAITSPAAGATVSGRSASISATASDASGIASVAFYVDGVLLTTDTAAPYTANWNLRKAASGAHTLLARATDKKGNVSTQSIVVNVK